LIDENFIKLIISKKKKPKKKNPLKLLQNQPTKATIKAETDKRKTLLFNNSLAIQN
jgi:hypothetical protein